jgi:hypothetical protein
MREREGFLRRMEERLSRMSGWLSARQGGGEHGAGRHERVEALRRELEIARRKVGDVTHDDLARVRASLEDLRHDYDAPHTALHRAELETLRRHLHTTSRLLDDRSNLDSPRWAEANEEYDRSWTELERAFEGEHGAASP